MLESYAVRLANQYKEEFTSYVLAASPEEAKTLAVFYLNEEGQPFPSVWEAISVEKREMRIKV